MIRVIVNSVVVYYVAPARNPGQGQVFRREKMVGIDCVNEQCTNPLCDCDPCLCTEQDPCACCVMWDGGSIEQSD